MWTFLTKLCFSDHGKYPRHHCSYTPAAVAHKLNYFPKFVSRVLFHLNTSTIEEFTLRISERYDPYYLTYNCIWSGIESITIEAPLLELVKMVKSEYEIIKFRASHIKNFSCGTRISSFRSSQTILLDEQHISFATLHAFVNHCNSTSVEEIWTFLRKLLRLFVNTEFLHLRIPDNNESLALGERYLARVPAFRMLVHLNLHSVTCDVLLDFLLKSPCLKTLGLVLLDKMAADYEEEESQDFATVVPDCFLSTLEVVKFGRYVGYECELSFVKFVMENAKVLERISFSFPPYLSCSEV